MSIVLISADHCHCQAGRSSYQILESSYRVLTKLALADDLNLFLHISRQGFKSHTIILYHCYGDVSAFRGIDVCDRSLFSLVGTLDDFTMVAILQISYFNGLVHADILI